MPGPHHTRRHLDWVAFRLAEQRNQVPERRQILEYDVGPSVPQERAMARLQEAIRKMDKAVGRPWHAKRVQDAARAADRVLELG